MKRFAAPCPRARRGAVRAGARRGARRHLPRLRLRRGRDELGQSLLDRAARRRPRGRHQLHPAQRADRPADRRRQGDRQRRRGERHVHEPARHGDHGLRAQRPQFDFRSNPPLDGHAAALCALPARRGAVRGRRRLRHRDAQPAQGVQRLVRLSGGQRDDRDGARRRCAHVRRARRLPGRRRTLSIRGRLLPRAGGPNCSAPAGARVYHVLYGDRRDGRRPCRRPCPTVSARGAAGRRPARRARIRSCSARPTTPASARVELFDVTDSAAPQLVGAEDYTAGRTDAGAHCSARLARPCPDLARETVAPDVAAGRPAPAASCRTIDAGGNADRPRARTRRRRHAVGSRRAQRRGRDRDGHADRPLPRTPAAQVRTVRLRHGACASTGSCVNAIGQPIGRRDRSTWSRRNKRPGAVPRQAPVGPHHGADGSFTGRTRGARLTQPRAGAGGRTSTTRTPARATS